MERFTRRASVDDTSIVEATGLHVGTAQIKTLANPRRIDYFCNPHYAIYNIDDFAINENGAKVAAYSNYPPTIEKIVMNHYRVKSREEYGGKVKRGTADLTRNIYKAESFSHEHNNKVFDDSILKYRDKRLAELVPNGDIIKNFAKLKQLDFDKLLASLSSILLPGFLEDDAQNFFSDYQKRFEYFNLMTKFLNETPIDFFRNKTELYLTCLTLSGFLKDTFLDDELGRLFEEFSLCFVYKTLLQTNIEAANLHQLINELPKILTLPYPAVDDIRHFCITITPAFMNIFREYNQVAWQNFTHFQYVLDMLKVLDHYKHK